MAGIVVVSPGRHNPAECGRGTVCEGAGAFEMDEDKDQQITLLVGFDAAYYFLQARWEAGAKSDDIANLLASMERSPQINTQPLDIGQWSDWLDAVLSVRPDFREVREIRQRIQDDWRASVQIYEMPSSPEKQAALNEYRANAAHHTWHRMGDHPVNASDAYEAMSSFISTFWERDGRHFSGLGIILSDLKQADSAARAVQWNAWLAAIKKALQARTLPAA
jgi:hypothetical protein